MAKPFQIEPRGNIYAADIETTGLIDSLRNNPDARLHNLGLISIDTGQETLFTHTPDDPRSHPRDASRHAIEQTQAALNTPNTLIMHNGIGYDEFALRLLGFDTSNLLVVDTLWLSWHLYPMRHRHGLADWGTEFGIPKPVVEDWQGQPQYIYDQRVMQDCRIQRMLWLKIWKDLGQLYPEEKDRWRLIGYLNAKAQHYQLQEETGAVLDREHIQACLTEWQPEIAEKTAALIEVLPRKTIYSSYSRIQQPYSKVTGKLTHHGKNWLRRCLVMKQDWGVDEITMPVGDEPGKPTAPQQVKDWLFSLGWEPATFDYKKNEDGSERAVPQINVPKSGGQLDPGVLALADREPKVQLLKGYAILRNRISILEGFLKSARESDGRLVGYNAALTNTLRSRHGGIVNLPGTDKVKGPEIRGSFTAPEGACVWGADLSSLEDRSKHHYQWALDPEYVKRQMHPEFDPHVTIAETAGLITPAQHQLYLDIKHGRKPMQGNEQVYDHIVAMRKSGKSANYACAYGAGAPTVARTAGIELDVAENLVSAFRALNWSLQAISDGLSRKEALKLTWQYNPVSGFWYQLRSKKDGFSTLNQGTGSYIFDLWSWHVIRLSYKRYGRAPSLFLQMHDELGGYCKDGPLARAAMKSLIDDALQLVNDTLQLNRAMSADIEFGPSYANTH